MHPDINEQLTIKSLYKYLQNESVKACLVADFEQISGLNSDYFLPILKSIEKKNLVEIGFFKREHIIKVSNWYSKYSECEGLYIKLTKYGTEICRGDRN